VDARPPGRRGLVAADGEVVLQTMPRVFGFVFNPVSFWFCHDRDGGLRAVLAEVSNTFGERHNYLVAHPDRRPSSRRRAHGPQGLPRVALLPGAGRIPLPLRPARARW
jgi:hypothetical protein